MRAAALPILLATLGCRAPEPAPDDLDGLFHYYWDHYQDGDARDLADALAALDAAIPHDALPLRGAQTRLTSGQLATVGLEGIADPSRANGFFVITEMTCTLDELEEIFIALDQDVLHPNTYDAYERVYTSDLDPYLAREVEHLTWLTTLDASPAGFAYTERLSGGVRWVPGRDATGPESATLVGRTWLLEPATEDEPDQSFDQDYQLDVYYERAPGEVVHVYGIWREITIKVLGATQTQDDNALIQVTLSESEKWDKRVAEDLCGR